MNIRTQTLSKNFNFLESKWPDLANLAYFAESYLYDDAPSSMVKIRIFAEKMVEILYYELGLSKPTNDYNNPSFLELLQNPSFLRAIPRDVVNYLHYIRREGNKSAHGSSTDLNSGEVIKVLQNVHKISRWFFQTLTKTDLKESVFIEPDKSLSKKELINKKEELEKKLELLEKQESEKRINTPIEEATEKSIKTIYERGIKEAETIGFTEEETRKLLINTMIKDAGWIIHVKKEDYNPDSDKPQAIIEYPVEHLVTTKSGKGSIDYVLMGKNGNPIAVIEAKKTSKNADEGKTQAEDYANGLEKMTGQRPLIFYTNGHEINFWDDRNYPPRIVWSFFDSDKLEYLLFQRKEKKKSTEIELNTSIAGRPYQLEGISRVLESFERKERKALIVMATGTGKTRVAMSIIDSLMRANWVKRVLFLVDRVELGTQAKEAFQEHIPSITPIVLSSKNNEDKDCRAYIATYPAIMSCYSSFNAGFFDLIIADESHRSIYKYYREVFQYFDALQIGLTATPVDFINRNTFNFFQLQSGNPTFNYSFDEATSNNPPFLVKPKIENTSTYFIQKGIKYDELTEEQKLELEEQGEDPRAFQFNREDVDKNVMNKDSNKKLLRNLMDKGIKNKNGTRPGKTIVFARNHNHAKLLLDLFNELYPQFEGKMARVIDNQEPKAEDLIRGFKGKKKEFVDLDIAISVDMLDTGIDVPEIVNLVFARPVFSKVKFWQMIGRGTRLCKNILTDGKDKEYFLIFDPWRNFEFFGINPDGIEAKETLSTTERLFGARLNLLRRLSRNSSNNNELVDFRDHVIALIREDISKLPEESVNVKESWREIEQVSKDSFWRRQDNNFFNMLSLNILPLMCWRKIIGEDDAIRFDIKIARLQLTILENNRDRIENYKTDILSDIERLRTNLNQVKKEIDFIEAVKQNSWWENIGLERLEELRIKLRDLMQYRSNLPKVPIKIIDVNDPIIPGNDSDINFEDKMELYKERVIKVLKDLCNDSLTLQKIKRGIPVTESDINSLQPLILQRDPGIDINELKKLYPDKTISLDKLIRSLIGMDIVTVQLMFDDFRKKHTTLNANQIQFLNLIEQEISKAGGMNIDKLYDHPFTAINSSGIDGVFSLEEADELIDLVKKIAV